MISCGDPEADEVAGPAACARTWLRLELLMVRVISWGPVEVDTSPGEVTTCVRSCVPGYYKAKQNQALKVHIFPFCTKHALLLF